MAQSYAVCEKCGQMNRFSINDDKDPICGACKVALPVHGAVVNASEKTFHKLIQKSPVPVVVDFWAPWCGPCRVFGPIFEDVAKSYAGKILFVKLNSDESPHVSQQVGIRGIPTTIAFKKGKEVSRQSGALPKDHFINWLSGIV